MASGRRRPAFGEARQGRPAFGEARRRRLALLGAALLVRPAAAAPPVPFLLTQGCVRTITYEGFSKGSSWALLPDETLELFLRSTNSRTVLGIAEFHYPMDFRSYDTLEFEAKSQHGGERISVGLDGAQSARLPQDQALSTHWRRLTVRLTDMSGPYDPQAVHRIRFEVVGVPGERPLPTEVTVRNVRVLPTRSGVPPAPTSPTVSVSPRSAPFDSSTRSMEPTPGFIQRRGGRVGKLLFAAGLLSLFFLRRKGRQDPGASISPIYEINTRTWKSHYGEKKEFVMGGFRQIALADLQRIKAMGFRSLWMMGTWEIGTRVKEISRRYAKDFAGSPFAISDYRIAPELGTEEEFREFVHRAHSVGLAVLVDFVPNHMAIDSPWLQENPEFFLHRTLSEDETTLPDYELERRYPGYFPVRTPAYAENGARVPKTLMVAYGKDPYFYPWIDTAQLDYANPALRQRMIEVLCRWARVADGVRCDMAMLALREQVKIHRHPEMSWEDFNTLMPREFWTEAIPAVRKINPHFAFIAECYWAMEGHLQQLGFDHTYNKAMYEALCGALHCGNAEGVMNFLRMLGSPFLQRTVNFLENHDEERAMVVLGEERQKAAAAALCTLPGVALLHQGQLEGRRERLPVQRVVPLHEEKENAGLKRFYEKLLQLTNLPLFRQGEIAFCYANNSALLAFGRVLGAQKALVVINVSSQFQKGSVFLPSGFHFQPRARYLLHDLFFGLKEPYTLARPTVQATYRNEGSALSNQGLYVELDRLDAHIFLLEPEPSAAVTARLASLLRRGQEAWQAWPAFGEARHWRGSPEAARLWRPAAWGRATRRAPANLFPERTERQA